MVQQRNHRGYKKNLEDNEHRNTMVHNLCSALLQPGDQS